MLTLNAEKHNREWIQGLRAEEMCSWRFQLRRGGMCSSEHPQNPVRTPLTLSSRNKEGTEVLPCSVSWTGTAQRWGKRLPSTCGLCAGRHRSKPWNNHFCAHLETSSIIPELCIFKSSCCSSAIFVLLLKKQEERTTKMLDTTNES